MVVLGWPVVKDRAVFSVDLRLFWNNRFTKVRFGLRIKAIREKLFLPT